jgi:hypothetical protein
MILKAQKSDGRRAIHWAFLLIPFLVAILWFAPDFVRMAEPSDINIFCDAEHVSDGNFVTNGHIVGNGSTQSDEKSFSGRYSSKVTPQQKYGMTITIPTPAQHTKYVVSIRRWTQSPEQSAIAVSGNEGSNFYLQTSETSEKNAAGWETLRLDFNLPDDGSVTSLKIFPYSFDKKSISYWDDLRIETIDLNSLDYAQLPRLHFYLDNKAVKKLGDKRTDALELGILKTGEDDWVKAKMTIDDEEVPTEVKLRLKGDWTDHLEGDYWSYRVQMPTERSWNRLQTFSLQDPLTRSYLHEWLFHKALEEEDIITPRYGFVLLKENTKPQVLYAYEEHFDKQIAEFKDRREGVIVKFSENAYWDQLIRNRKAQEEAGYRNAYETADILPFKAGRTVKNPKLLEQYEHASKLMTAFRDKSAPVADIFDIERLATFYALSDVFDAMHGSIWHNMRFYYNPVTRKLEPIGFDGFTEEGPFKTYSGMYFGEFKSSNGTGRWDALYYHLFQDEKFNELYTAALLKFSDANYLSALQQKHADALYGHELQIRTYIDSAYTFDLNPMRTRNRRIHNDVIPYSQNSLKVYREKNKKGITTYWTTNHHPLPLEIIGGSTKDGGEVIEGEHVLIRSNRKAYPKEFTEITLPQGSKQACFKLPGLDSVFYTEIFNWQRPGSDLDILYSSSSAPKIPLPEEAYSNENNIITIRSGTYQITSPLVIPEEHSLVVEAGTEIDFINNSYLLSYSRLLFQGTSEAPIEFNSSDKSSQGVQVIQAKEHSIVTYTRFNNFNTLEENEWQLTGAVTFYESDVQFEAVTVSNNSCEDALNLVRSKFEITGLNINHTFADGFDGDFCKGTINNSYFYKTGNDGLDFSGSNIDVVNVTLNEIGDKGISAGEQATLNILDVKISKAQIGIASKDLSVVTVKNTSLTDCAQGFAAYRKKPEFGGGTITVESYTTENIERLTNLDSESIIKLPN